MSGLGALKQEPVQVPNDSTPLLTVLKWPTPAVVAAHRKADRLAASKEPLTSEALTNILPQRLHAHAPNVDIRLV